MPRVLGAMLLFVLLSSASAAAASLTLAWDANSQSDLAGYIVYYGTTSGTYTNSSDVGNTTTFTATNLAAGQTYYFAVLAYSTTGVRSLLSQEVSGTTAPPAAAVVTITPSTSSMTVGGSTNLTAQAFDGVGNPVSGIAFTWTTGNASVATLSASAGGTNTVTARGAGSTTVTVSGGDQVATATITVSAAVARIAVTPSTASMKVGETASLAAQAFDSANNPLSNVPLTWATGNASIVSLTATSGATVPVSAAGVGTTSVTVRSGSISAASAITVAAAPVVNHVTITPATSNLVSGQSQQLVAIAYDSTNAPIQGVPFTWTTSNSGVAALATTTGATVSLTAQSTGAATLTATATTNGTSAQATVNVSQAATVTRVSVTPGNPSVRLGWRQTMTAQGFDASNQPVGSATFTWTSSNTHVVALGSTAGSALDIVANAIGSATLTATENATGQRASTTITVTLGDTLTWDTFTGATGTQLPAHSPDLDLLGTGWAISGSAVPVLDSGMARVTTAGGASSIVYATTQTAAPDARVATSWQVRGATMWGGLALRASDANNLIFAGYRSGELAVYRVRNGTWTRLVGSAITVGVGTTHQIEAAVSGATIQVYWDGTLTLQTSDSFNKTVDRHGLAWANGIDTASGYDSFRVNGTTVVAALPPPAPAPPAPSPGAPAAPSAPSVTAGSSGGSAPVPVVAPFGLISSVTDATVILQWSAPTAFPTASYILEVGSAPGLSDLTYNDTGSLAVSFAASPVAPGVYFVRVRARSADGVVSAASNETMVTVGSEAPTCTPAQAASNLSASVDGPIVTLTWQAGDSATSYVIEAGSAPGSSNIASFNTQSQATSYVATGVGDGTYFVRVRSTNSCGARSTASNEVVLSVGR